MAARRERRFQLRRPHCENIVAARDLCVYERHERIEVAHATGRGKEQTHAESLGGIAAALPSGFDSVPSVPFASPGHRGRPAPSARRMPDGNVVLENAIWSVAPTSWPEAMPPQQIFLPPPPIPPLHLCWLSRHDHVQHHHARQDLAAMPVGRADGRSHRRHGYWSPPSLPLPPSPPHPVLVGFADIAYRCQPPSTGIRPGGLLSHDAAVRQSSGRGRPTPTHSSTPPRCYRKPHDQARFPWYPARR
jgi:hypothetical protein